MQIRRLAALAAALLVGHAAQAATLTPPNLAPAVSLNNQDLLLVWPYAAGGPLEAMTWSTMKGQIQGALGGAFLVPGNNLSDVGNPTTARTNLGLGSAALANTGTSGATIPLLNGANTWTGVQSYNAGDLVVKGATSGTLDIRCAVSCGTRTLTFPAATIDFSVTGGASQVVKQTTAGGALTVGQLQCSDLSDGVSGGCGAFVVTGSLTPSLAYETSGTSSFSYSSQAGSYVCMNKVVTGWVRVTFTPTNGTASGSLYWTNPPYAPVNAFIAADVQFGPPAFFSSSGWAGLSTLSYGPALNSSVHIVFDNVSGSTITPISTTNSTTGTAKTLSFYFNYLTSSSC